MPSDMGLLGPLPPSHVRNAARAAAHSIAVAPEISQGTRSPLEPGQFNKTMQKVPGLLAHAGNDGK